MKKIINFLLLILILLQYPNSAFALENKKNYLSFAEKKPSVTNPSHKKYTAAQKKKIEQAFGNIELSILPNMGQMKNDVIKYYTDLAGQQIRFMENGISFSKSRISDKSEFGFKNNKTEHLVWNLMFVGASKNMSIEVVGKGSANYNYLLEDIHIEKVSSYTELFYRNIYPGIDLKYYGATNNQVEYDFILQSKANVDNIHLNYEGIEYLDITKNGDLKIKTSWGELIENAPISYQIIEGKKVSIKVDFRIIDKTSFGFEIKDSKYNSSFPLVIDPITLEWGTFIGTPGSNNNYAFTMDLNSLNEVYVGGLVETGVMPVTAGAFQTTRGTDPGGLYTNYANFTNSFFYNDNKCDAVVYKLSRNGDSLLWCTYLGGNGFDVVTSVIVSPDSNHVYVTGITMSSNFPMTVAGTNSAIATSYDNTFGGASGGLGKSDAFIAVFNSNGTKLRWSTYLGGAEVEEGYHLALDDSNNVYVTGGTASGSGFPISPSGNTIGVRGNMDVYVTKFTKLGSLMYSKVIGGESARERYECGFAIEVKSNHSAIVCGTARKGFPFTDSSAFTGGNVTRNAQQGFVLGVAPSGSGSLLFCSKIGGYYANDNIINYTLEGTQQIYPGTYVYDMVLDDSNNIYLTGSTNCDTFSTTAGAYQTTRSGGFDGFILKFDSLAHTKNYCSLIGGTQQDFLFGIDIDCNHNPYITGKTAGATSNNYPVTANAFQPNYGGSYGDLIYSGFYNNGTQLSISSFLGGADYDYGFGQIKSNGSDIFLVGTTHSGDFPVTAGSYLSTHPNAALDAAFVVKLKFNVVTLPSDSTFCGSATNTVYLRASDPAPYSGYWTQITGPNTATLSDINSINCTASNMIYGYYKFVFNATDPCRGDVSRDTAEVVVKKCSGDTDGDSIADSDDLDDDNDGISDLVESGGVDPLADADADGIPNYLDPSYAGYVDSNSDGVNDNFDKDKDGIINELDLDSDNDGILDVIEAGGADTNNDGIIDGYVDKNRNGISDPYDIACNGSTVNGRGYIVNATSGTVDNSGLAVDNNNATYAVLNSASASIDIQLEHIVPSGTVITVRLRNNGGGNGTVSVQQSIDDATYTNSVAFTSTGTTTNFSYTLTANANFLRITRTNANATRIYHTSYSAVICSSGTAITNPDTDGDGIKNFLDLDSDNDGITDLVEAGGVDTNGEGFIDGTSDTDGDGIRNAYDANNGGDAISNLDTDSDGVKNYLDLDSDNDGIPDVVEVGKPDTNNDGKIDSFTDTDSDGLDQSVDGDTNNDGTVESTANASIITGTDGNSDGIPDTWTRANNDANGLPNPYDLDADGDGILDVREAGLTDATNDGIADGTLGVDGWSDTVDALGSLNLPNTDSQGNANFIDIDSDNDGIVDVVEAQTTAGYVAPAGTDSDGDGIDNNYDNNDASFGGSATNGLTPINTDGADNADYLDLDSDNDRKSDRVEGWDTDGNGSTNGSEVSYVGTTDSDNDGLLNEYDVDDVNINPTNSSTPSSHPDMNNPGGDRDWRQASDRDLDGKLDTIDIDDDNDGIPDTVESGGYDPLADGDSDGIANYLDSSPGAGLPTWTDSNSDNINDAYDKDGDGIINELDLDSDNDGIPDIIEATGVDSGNDGMVDSYVDTDNDGLSDQWDSNNGGVNIPNPDSDGDGIKNFLDLDADGDGILDVREAGFTDTNNDGIVDGTLGTDGWSNTIDALGSLGLTNTDSHGNPNYIDIDADNDGIVDIVEAQTTTGYLAPSGSDSDGDGIDNNYDNNDAAFGGNSNNGLTPTNSESTGNPDYTDSDADDDLKTDRLEGWDTNGNGAIDGAEIAYVGTTDSDGDGLFNEYDVNDASWNPTNGTTPTSHPDMNNPGGDRDWREYEFEGGHLPIQIISSNVELIDENGLVSWVTASEVNNDYFEIERSADGRIFEKVGSHDGAGNSNVLVSYSFIDENPMKGISYYRIKQIDFDGKFSFSKKMVLNNSSINIIKSEIFPNPAKNNVSILVNQEVEIEIYSADGLLIKSFEKNEELIIKVDLTNLPSGVYYILLRSSYSSEYKKLIVEKT